MKKTFKYFLFIFISILVFLAYQSYRENQIDRVPIWHPFSFNSDVTFESLVDDGYSYDNNQCGQLVYSKKVKDTIVAYGIYIDRSQEVGIGSNESDLEKEDNLYYPSECENT